MEEVQRMIINIIEQLHEDPPDVKDSDEFVFAVRHFVAKLTSLENAEQYIFVLSDNLIPDGILLRSDYDPHYDPFGIDRDLPNNTILIFYDPRTKLYREMKNEVLNTRSPLTDLNINLN